MNISSSLSFSTEGNERLPKNLPQVILFIISGISLYRVRHIKCYRALALKLLIISKNVSNKSFSVREGPHTGPPYFFIGRGAETTSHIGITTFKGSTNLGLGLPTEVARSDDPRLASTR